MDKNYYDEDGKLCEARVRKNLVLAELGKPLDMPLAILNTHCEFKKEWNKIQNKWHGLPPEVKAKKKEYYQEYYQRPEVKAKKKEYNQRPEVKAKRKEYYQEYYQRPEVKAKKKEYNQRPEVKAKQKEYYQKYYQRPEVKAKKKEYRQKPEVKAKQKEYYQSNREEILNRLHKRRTTHKN